MCTLSPLSALALNKDVLFLLGISDKVRLDRTVIQ